MFLLNRAMKCDIEQHHNAHQTPNPGTVMGWSNSHLPISQVEHSSAFLIAMDNLCFFKLLSVYADTWSNANLVAL